MRIRNTGFIKRLRNGGEQSRTVFVIFVTQGAGFNRLFCCLQVYKLSFLFDLRGNAILDVEVPVTENASSILCTGTWYFPIFKVLLLVHNIFQTVFFKVGAYWRRGYGTGTDEFRRSEASREYEVGIMVFLAVLRIRIRMGPASFWEAGP
jgi:hypothetical protein